MKLAVTATLTVVGSFVNGQRNDTDENSIGRMGAGGGAGVGMGRRYTDLLKLVQHFTPDFDERKVGT